MPEESDPSDRGEGGLDPGLQAEQGSVAWQRTALSAGGVGALLLRAGGSKPWAAVPAMLGIALALVLLVAGNRHHGRAVRPVRSGRSPMAPTRVAVVSAGVTAPAIAAIVLRRCPGDAEWERLVGVIVWAIRGKVRPKRANPQVSGVISVVCKSAVIDFEGSNPSPATL